MKKFNCPSCGADVIFQSNVSVYAVCKYCSSMVVRRDVDVESIGIMAALPEDLSPFQLGTQGYYQGVRFTIVGRLKIAWEYGSWNEWFIVSDNGKRGWLAEAQGFYAVSFEIEGFLKRPDLAWVKNVYEVSLRRGPGEFLGALGVVDNIMLRIVDIKHGKCSGSEGELPFVAPQGRSAIVIDCVGANGEFASLEVDRENPRFFFGNYVGWKDLRCSYHRQFEGW